MNLPHTWLALLRRVLARDGWHVAPNGLAECGAQRLQFFAERAGQSPHPRVVVLQRPKGSSVTLWTTVAALRSVAAGRLPVFPTDGNGVRSFTAEVLANIPVGKGTISHYLLKFRARELGVVMPPQFVMTDTTPQPDGQTRPCAAEPYLKRPFGIYRCHYSGVPRRLVLPPSLSLAVQLPVPDHYELLYKVLPDGRGTNRMTQLKPGDKVHMLGPLGRPFDVRQLVAAHVEEVHVIGGGVGMAPLILLVEMLRFHGLPVRVFLGVQHLDSIRYRDELAAAFTDRRRDACIYLDDLVAAGVPAECIHVACDEALPRGLGRGIPKANLFHGFVTEQYAAFLRQRTRTARASAVKVFTCGPNRMMERVAELGKQHGLPVWVLLEKRMGCGIGVCFSCVQRIKRPDGATEYARVCKEGPLFPAEQILWSDGLKPESATCDCAARC